MKLFEDLPSQNTPITAENLNQIQDNLVVVSATEPTGDNREKVWMQKGKNLFDKNRLFTGYRFGSDGLIFADSAYSATDFIPVKPNTTYTVNWTMETRECVCYYDETKTFISRNTSTKPFTTPNNCKYIRASTLSTGIGTAQLEQSSTATEYEEYVEPKIYVKNNNGIYEEFINTKDIIELQTRPYFTKATYVNNQPSFQIDMKAGQKMLLYVYPVGNATPPTLAFIYVDSIAGVLSSKMGDMITSISWADEKLTVNVKNYYFRYGYMVLP